MTVVKAFSGAAAAVFWWAVMVPSCIVIFNVLEFTGRPFRPVWDG